MASRVLLAAALAAAAGCAGRAPTATRMPEPPGKPLFEPYPAAEVAALKSPHDYRGKPLCQRCHLPDGKLTADANGLCRECHRFGHGNHPVDVVQRTAAKDLPLLAGGRVACHTCHDPHAKKSALRKPFDDLCIACHGTKHRGG